MLNLKKVLGAKPKEHVVSELAELLTPWGEAIDAAHVLEEHPNPQFARSSYRMLNGIWNCAFVQNGHEPTADLLRVVTAAHQPSKDEFSQTILVPFSPESVLSGVKRQLQPDELLWYHRTIEAIDCTEGTRHLLHFQAVDYACAVFLNGQLAGTHLGGYTPFVLDITDLIGDGSNELAVCVADPSEFGGRLRGKQRFDRGDIWYTAQSGIWQSVWLETVPATYIESVAIEPDVKTGVLAIGARIAGLDSHPKRSNSNASDSEGANPPDKASLELSVTAYDADGCEVAAASQPAIESTCAIAVHIPDVRLWSPDDPYLYRLAISLGNDHVESYCGFRTIAMRKDEQGHPRMFLNDKPLFVRGVLDQAYWSDGLMTAPADDALVYDIEAMRKDGFNLMRKHIKIESARWYYHCDRLGMLVLQDMVSGGAPEIQTWHWSYKPTLFKVSWKHYRDDKLSHQENLGAGDAGYRKEWSRACAETIRLLSNHPCIIGWSLFNEGWGQFDAREAYHMASALDPTRCIDATSGWYDQGCGDFYSVHNYFRDLSVWPDRKHGRAFFVSEFGGLTHRVDGHASLPEAYGYEPYDELGEWRNAVRTMLAHMDSLEEKGLAGYVYTQVSDIEEETNGILTYDRRINKLAE